MNRVYLLATGIVALVLIENVYGAAVCPQCKCVATYEPVCAQRADTGVVRGFSSRCLLDCSNKCRKPNQQFKFLANGRCGKIKATAKPSVGAKTSTTTIASNLLK